MSLHEYGQNHTLDQILGSGTPTDFYIAALLEEPAIADDGTQLVEPSDANYARVQVSNTATEWPDATNGRKTNGVTITFPQASEDWGRVDAFAICFASTDGNVLGSGLLNKGIHVRNGDTAEFAVDTLVVTAQ